MPSDILLDSFAPLSVPVMPAETFYQIAIAFPDSDLAGFEFARIEALAPDHERPRQGFDGASDTACH